MMCVHWGGVRSRPGSEAGPLRGAGGRWAALVVFLRARARSNTFHHPVSRAGDKGRTSPSPLDPAPAASHRLLRRFPRPRRFLADRRDSTSCLNTPFAAVLAAHPGKQHRLGSFLMPPKGQLPGQSQWPELVQLRCGKYLSIRAYKIAAVSASITPSYFSGRKWSWKARTRFFKPSWLMVAEVS